MNEPKLEDYGLTHESYERLRGLDEFWSVRVSMILTVICALGGFAFALSIALPGLPTAWSEGPLQFIGALIASGLAIIMMTGTGFGVGFLGIRLLIWAPLSMIPAFARKNEYERAVESYRRPPIRFR